MAAVLRFQMAKGEDITFSGVHTVSQTDLTPVNITGWTITVTVETRSGTLLFTKTATVVSGSAGTYTWPVVQADTNIANITAQTYVIDIFRTDAGAHREMGIGTFQVTPDVLYGI